jgi:hypothetical protein
VTITAGILAFFALAFQQAARGRLGSNYRLLVYAQLFDNVDRRDPVLYSFREDSFLRLELRRYF